MIITTSTALSRPAKLTSAPNSGQKRGCQQGSASLGAVLAAEAAVRVHLTEAGFGGVFLELWW